MDEIIEQIRQLPAIVQQVIQLSIWFLLLMSVFAPLEKLFAQRRQKILRRSFFTDAGYYFFNNILLKSALVLPLAAIAWLARHLVPAAVTEWTADLPFLARLAAALVVGEFGYYWAHRAMHEVPLLWRFHAIHHGPEEMDWLVNTHAHPIDVVIGRMGGFIPLYALGLAQPMAGQSIDAVPYLFMTIGMLWGFLIHANLRWRFGWLSLLISTPAFHHWHHTNDEHIDKNYASMLPVMDLLFGSWYMPSRQWPPRYGIISPMADGLVGQMLQPFLPAEKQVEPGPPQIEAEVDSIASN